MKQILKLVNLKIKKFFSIYGKNDICHKMESADNLGNSCNETDVEEYLNSYRSATRWQTV